MEKIDARTLKPEVQEQLRKQVIQLRQKGHPWEQSTHRHSTNADPIRGNRYKASYQTFILLLDQFDQILGNPMTF